MARLTLDEARVLARRALSAAGAAEHQAVPTAAALVAADADGLASHGLARAPAYADQVASGKVDGRAFPVQERSGDAVVRIDAGFGFAFPAIDLALEAALALTPRTGVTAASVRNSHHAGAMGRHVERLAENGLVGLAFTNSPAAIAPWGGRTGLYGTNPIAFACPRPRRSPLVVDLSLSKVARGKIMVAAKRGEPIVEGWALDAEGHPTVDAEAALAGTMLPMGDARGAALVLAVELLAAGLTGAHFGFEASSFFTADGDAPAIGHLFLAMDPAALGGEGWAERVEVLLTAILAQDGTRLPGDRRLAAREAAERDGIDIDSALLADLERRADP